MIRRGVYRPGGRYCSPSPVAKVVVAAVFNVGRFGNAVVREEKQVVVTGKDQAGLYRTGCVSSSSHILHPHRY